MYRDATGQTWSLAVDLPACRRVRDMVGINLLTLRVDRLCFELSDPIRLCEVLWAIAKPEADAQGLDLTAFLQRMAVDLPPIGEQLLESLPDFFTRLGEPLRANQLRIAIAKTKALPPITPDMLNKALAETMDVMVSQILKASTLNDHSGTDATNSQESQESIPTSTE